MRELIPIADRGPLRVMFVITSMPVGGAETLLVNLIRRMDRDSFAPELCCLKSFGPLGQTLAEEVPAFERLLGGKYDLCVWSRLARLFRERRLDAVITVGAGDKMFWGRLAAWRANVPVVLSALHSTGWPDQIGRLNRCLTPLTDAFIGVAAAHGRHLIENEKFPAHKVRVIPNGVDVDRFAAVVSPADVRKRLGLAAAAPVAGIVAALRPEKNHELFLRVAAMALKEVPDARFLIIGDGPQRAGLEALSRELGLEDAVLFLGTRGDVPKLLSTLDVFVLTSHIEANPVSILEAMAAGKPVIAPRVGSINESVADGVSGYLFEAGDQERAAGYLVQLLRRPDLGRQMGEIGRQTVVDRWSLDAMVHGYQELIREIYTRKCENVRGAPLLSRANVPAEPPVV